MLYVNNLKAAIRSQMRPSFHSRFLKTEALEAIALALVLFILYTAGACRTIYVGDSGEPVAAVHLLGIPHPSGYPLYVMLGKLWTLVVPLGSIAYRMSLFSAACAAGACGALHWLGRRSGLHPVAAASSALLLAFSPSFWAEANIQRVYSLNALFVALATAAAYTTNQQRVGSVAADAGGDFVVVWSSLGQGGSLYDVFGQRLAANGTFMGGEFQVNTYTTGSRRVRSVAMDTGGISS